MAYKESGSALVLALIAICLLSFLGLFMALDANTGVKISDNYEAQIQATYAALAGLNHSRVLIRGLAIDDVLKGPDGTFSSSGTYLTQARRFDFRNPLPMSVFYGLDLSNPAIDLSGMFDDGVISTGFCNGINGTVLIPPAGIGLLAANPYRSGTLVTSRYFVKVTDNNGEASEITGDPADNPFIDGDGITIVRSVGLSKTFAEVTGPITRLNSVAVFEARFKRLTAFDVGPALVLLGSSVDASFGGTYEIIGDRSAGIGTIDTDMADAGFPDQIIAAAAGPGGRITGGGLPDPAVQDISAEVFANINRSSLMSPRFLSEFIHNRASRFADFYFDGDRAWANGAGPYGGAYDIYRPWNASGQDPKVTVVNGNLHIEGNYSGGGLLIVTGTLSYAGQFMFNGLVLVIGSGKIVADGLGQGIQGGLIVAALEEQNGNAVFGSPAISIGGASRISANRDAVRMALSLIPVSQISFREIAGSDP